MKMINPYINFPGNTEEAFRFYHSVFGGQLLPAMRYKEMPGAEKMPANEQEKVMHIALSLGNGLSLMGSDAVASMGDTLKNGNNFSLTVEAESTEEADALFAKLSQGGSVTMPMENAFWGDYFGMLTDKFGIRWMVTCPVKK